MTFDGSSAESRPSSTFRAPAQHAIREFLAGHRLRPARSARERALGRSPLGESGAQWYWSAVGQLEVTSRLENLGPEWTVVHGIGGPSMNIDHLVIGPAGVFAVCTHDHTKQNVWVSGRAFVADGHSLQYLRAAEEAIGYVERTLEREAGVHIRASAVITVIDPGSLRVRDLPRDIFVIAASSVTAWLRLREPALGAETVSHLAAVARAEETWSSEPRSVADVESLQRERAEFDRVRHEVATARGVRAAWAISIVSLLVGMMLAVGLLQLVAAQG